MPLSDTPQVSVVVVNWNRSRLLARCLESLAVQQGPVRFEVILVDNGSEDDSVAMAKGQYGNHPRFELIVLQNQDNKGFCEANNQGMELARGEFIALLNNDAEAEPGWLGALLTAFAGENGRVGMAASKILVYEDPRYIDKVGHLIYPDGQNWGRGYGELDQGQYDQIEETLWPDGCAAMYRRSLVDEVGGFDTDLFAYGDDAELGLRARIAGWGCLYIPTAVVRHHRGSTLGQLSMRRVELIERNRVLLAVKHFPWSLLCLNGPYFIARLAVGVWAAVTGRGEAGRHTGWSAKFQLATAICKADLQALRMIPQTLRKRKRLQPLRRLSPREVKELLRRHRVPAKRLMAGL